MSKRSEAVHELLCLKRAQELLHLVGYAYANTLNLYSQDKQIGEKLETLDNANRKIAEIIQARIVSHLEMV